MSELEQLRALRTDLAQLYNATPASHAKRRRFLGRLDRTVYIMIAHLKGTLLDEQAYGTLAEEFNAASGQLKKSTEQLGEITRSMEKASSFMNTLSAIFKTLKKP